MCGEDAESIDHMLFECCYARQVWAVSTITNSNGGFDDGYDFVNINFLSIRVLMNTNMYGPGSFGISGKEEMRCYSKQDAATLWNWSKKLIRRKMSGLQVVEEE